MKHSVIFDEVFWCEISRVSAKLVSDVSENTSASVIKFSCDNCCVHALAFVLLSHDILMVEMETVSEMSGSRSSDKVSPHTVSVKAADPVLLCSLFGFTSSAYHCRLLAEMDR